MMRRMPDPLDPPPPGPPGPGGHDAPPPDPDLPGAPGARPEAGVGPDPGPDRGQGRWPERGADRYLGGVASGIAHAVDVDPFVVRLGLALGVLYVPQLVVLYTLAWLLLPDERTHRSLLADRGGPHGWPAPVGVAALGIGAAVLAPDLGPGGDPELTFGALLLAMGFMLVTGRVGSTSPLGESRPGPDESVPGVAPQPGSRSFGAGLDDRLPSGSAAGLPASVPGADERVSPGTAGEPSRPGARRAAAPLVSWPPRGAQALRRERAPHQRAYLGWFGISALVVLLVGLAGLDQAWEPVDPGIVVSLCLLLVGAVLCVAGWRGRARLLLPGPGGAVVVAED